MNREACWWYVTVLVGCLVLSMLISCFQVARADVVVVCPDPGVVSSTAGIAACLSSVDGTAVDWVIQDVQETWMPVLSESDGYSIAGSIIGLWALAYAMLMLRRALVKR